MFWEVIAPGKENNAPAGKLEATINDAFGSFDSFKKEVSAAATTRFGSGWAWLNAGEDGKVEITSTPNQDNPIMEGKTAILGLDVWEHAYYLNYQNRRPDYIASFFNIINWDAVEKNSKTHKNKLL